LGKGAFGEVVKAQNILDGRIYAIKKIKLFRNLKKKILTEVKTLSRLYHKHIVRYYHSWTEVESTGVVSDSSEDEDLNFADDWLREGITKEKDGNNSPVLQPIANPRLKQLAANNKFKSTDTVLDKFQREPTFFGMSDEEVSDSDESSVSESSSKKQEDSLNETFEMEEHLECDTCAIEYSDWEVSDSEWEKLHFSIRTLHLCPNCYKKQLRQAGLDIKQVRNWIVSSKQDLGNFVDF
jgi:hypothetical protein